jgi:hypothetical protein
MVRSPPATRESIDMPSGTRYVVRSPAIVHEAIDGEAVIIDLESGTYFSAEGASAITWQRIGGGASAADLASAIAERYDGDPDRIGAAVVQFIEQLCQEGLIRPIEPGDEDQAPAPEAPGSSLPSPTEARPAFSHLALRRFTDLQELLLLDPIHEVDETGWPAPLARR